MGTKTAKLKWEWAGHVCRMFPQCWALITTHWVPWDAHRSGDRPKRNWRDDLAGYEIEWQKHAMAEWQKERGPLASWDAK